ncbi:MAG: SusF/SusE family outer membrane protein [Prevotellaceae bacterium]|jgi:hypothetical protein|nr:SusF/SusE family outer membrane protein [Prevotellaceae bacterium]
MKFLNKTLIISILAAMIFTACNSDNSPILTKIVSGEFDALPLDEFVLTEPAAGTNPLIITVTWTKTRFYLDEKESPVGSVKYLVEADIAGNNFANAITFAASDDNNPLAANLFVNDINSLLLKNFNAMAGQNLNLELRLRTNYGEDGAKNHVISTSVLALTFVPFRPENELIPAYLIGDMNAWDLNSKQFLMYREDNKPQNHIHTYTGKFGANTHFKFCSELALGDVNKMFGKGENNTLVVGGTEDFVIATEGYYTLTIDDKAKTYSITPFDESTFAQYSVMCFVGNFCNWGADGSDPEMQNFVVKTNGGADIIDNHNWFLEVDIDLVGYGVKFRANHDWGTKWCPIKSANNPYGVAEYNPTNDPNIDISLQGEGRYEVRFNDLTAHYFVKRIE